MSYPVQGGTELAEEQKKVCVTVGHVLSVLQPETLCAFRARSLVHFQDLLTDPKLTTAVTSLLLKRTSQKLCFSLEIYWHDLPCVTMSKALFCSPLKGRVSNIGLSKGNRPWYIGSFKGNVWESRFKPCQGTF